MFDDSTNNSGQGGDGSSTGPLTHSLGLGINPNPSMAGQAPAATPAPETPAQQAPSAPVSPVSTPQFVGPTPSPNTSANSNLEEIKVQALSQLSPLVNQLDQSPEEKYKTLMMMIQASDNQDLIGEAYAAAQNIADEKIKAEALLNIVNEINYFTQHKS